MTDHFVEVPKKVLSPSLRALCAELTDDLEEWVKAYLITDPADECTAASFERIERARAALKATPPPKPPTDEEIMELMPQQMRDDLANAARALAGFDRANVKAAGAMRIILNRHAVDHARAVLERWGK
jgi:hypothetical protein